MIEKQILLNLYSVLEYGIISYSFIDKTEQIKSTEDLEIFLIRQQDNSDVQKIIRKVMVAL